MPGSSALFVQQLEMLEFDWLIIPVMHWTAAYHEAILCLLVAGSGVKEMP